MRYPVMTEKQLALRWKVSVKTLRRWRQVKVGPVWRKLFRHVRYHESDIQVFERQSAQNWMRFLGRDENAPIILTPETIEGDSGKIDQDSDAETKSRYLTGKEVATITACPPICLRIVWSATANAFPTCPWWATYGTPFRKSYSGNWQVAHWALRLTLWCQVRA